MNTKSYDLTNNAPISNKSEMLPFKKPALYIAAFTFICFISLYICSQFNFYPVAVFEIITDPHMYYIKQFVHELPEDVQLKMQDTAQALNMNIYEYNLAMCGIEDEHFKWWKLF